MAIVGTRSQGPKLDINMTPMIDVLLVLIITFVLITPLTRHALEALVSANPRHPIETPVPIREL